MRTNYYLCQNCGKTTRHTEISQSEIAALGKQNILIRAALKFGHEVGIERLTGSILGLSNWKCTQCRLLTQRKDDGSITYTYGYGR